MKMTIVSAFNRLGGARKTDASVLKTTLRKGTIHVKQKVGQYFFLS